MSKQKQSTKLNIKGPDTVKGLVGDDWNEMRDQEYYGHNWLLMRARNYDVGALFTSTGESPTGMLTDLVKKILAENFTKRAKLIEELADKALTQISNESGEERKKDPIKVKEYQQLKAWIGYWGVRGLKVDLPGIVGLAEISKGSTPPWVNGVPGYLPNEQVIEPKKLSELVRENPKETLYFFNDMAAVREENFIMYTETKIDDNGRSGSGGIQREERDFYSEEIYAIVNDHDGLRAKLAEDLTGVQNTKKYIADCAHLLPDLNTHLKNKNYTDAEIDACHISGLIAYRMIMKDTPLKPKATTLKIEANKVRYGRIVNKEQELF